jgi:hypothetical protein
LPFDWHTIAEISKNCLAFIFEGLVFGLMDPEGKGCMILMLHNAANIEYTTEINVLEYMNFPYKILFK